MVGQAYIGLFPPFELRRVQLAGTGPGNLAQPPFSPLPDYRCSALPAAEPAVEQPCVSTPGISVSLPPSASEQPAHCPDAAAVAADNTPPSPQQPSSSPLRPRQPCVVRLSLEATSATADTAQPGEARDLAPSADGWRVFRTSHTAGGLRARAFLRMPQAASNSVARQSRKDSTSGGVLGGVLAFSARNVQARDSKKGPLLACGVSGSELGSPYQARDSMCAEPDELPFRPATTHRPPKPSGATKAEAGTTSSALQQPPAAGPPARHPSTLAMLRPRRRATAASGGGSTGFSPPTLLQLQQQQSQPNVTLTLSSATPPSPPVQPPPLPAACSPTLSPVATANVLPATVPLMHSTAAPARLHRASPRRPSTQQSLPPQRPLASLSSPAVPRSSLGTQLHTVSSVVFPHSFGLGAARADGDPLLAGHALSAEEGSAQEALPLQLPPPLPLVPPSLPSSLRTRLPCSRRPGPHSQGCVPSTRLLLNERAES